MIQEVSDGESVKEETNNVINKCAEEATDTKTKTSLPLAFVLTNAAFNDFLDFWVIDFIKAGWFYTLQKQECKKI